MAEDEKTMVHSISDLLGKSRAQHAYLIVLSAKTAALIGRMFKLDKPEIIMGRSAEAGLQIEDDGISRKHAKVQVGSDGKFQVVDLGSTNGTYLNGAKVNVALLADGDKIQIGTNTVVKFSLQDQLEEQYQKSIYESATRDGLTRIFNKKYFMDTLRKEFAYCLRHQMPLSLVMFDVDHFKVINDTYGHEIGDRALRLFARVLRDAIRPSDFVARQGGEEFLVVLPDCSLPDARLVAERVRTELTRALAQAEVPPFTVTIGLTRSEAGDAFSEVVARADAAMLKAKSLGRDRVLAAGDVTPPATQPRSPDGDEVVPGDAVFPAGESMLRPVPAVVGSIRISPEDDPPRDGVLEHHTVA